MRLIITLFVLSIGMSSWAQSGEVTVHGRVMNEKKTLGNIEIEVVQDNKILMDFITPKNGSYRLRLPLGHIYNVSFSKLGFIKKTVGINTIAKDEDSGQYFFQLDIDLFEMTDDEFLAPTVAKVFLKNASSGFVYDKSYLKTMTGEYEEYK